MSQQKNPTKTLVINKWSQSMTRFQNGDINSGFAYMPNSWGFLPFGAPGQLTWQENAIQIDPSGTVITDLIMAGKERVESGITYVYAIGHTGRLYKIQVNNPSVYNPNYDNPVLLTTLTSQAPTFTRGSSIEFYNSPQQIYIGSDMGVTRINFDGTGETFIGSTGTWTQTVPRPIKQFQGVLYAGNGSNIAKIDTTNTVVNYTQLSPGFPVNTQTRDLEVSVDGNYLTMIVSEIPLPDQTIGSVDTTQTASARSYSFKWNGSDQAASSYTLFPSYSITANKIFSNYEYNFGYDVAGAGLYVGTDKAVTLNLAESPAPNAIVSSGNIVAWGAPEFSQGFYKLGVYLYGAFDYEIPPGVWQQLLLSASGTETDVMGCPFSILVSNFNLGPSTSGYTGDLVSIGKVYFSTIETSSNTTKYKFYKFYSVSAGVSTPVLGTYQTQTEIFGRKMALPEIRIYGAPWVAGNSFSISLIGSSGTAIPNSTKTFSVGTNLTAGQDMAQYNPGIAPTYAVGLSITNTGSTNFTINKVEIDYHDAGK